MVLKRIVLGLAIFALAAIPVSASAGNGSHDKVTGDIWHANGSYGLANFAFSGHDMGDPADDKGFAYYSDSSGWWYGIATSVHVANATTAHMTVTVTESTHPAVPVGSEHEYQLYDLGEPGTLDWFSYFGGGHYTAEAGNIQVHFG